MSRLRADRYRRTMPVYALGDQVPDIHPDAYLSPEAVVIGSVTIVGRV